jgi:hypothetical protein
VVNGLGLTDFAFYLFRETALRKDWFRAPPQATIVMAFEPIYNASHATLLVNASDRLARPTSDPTLGPDADSG